jgi:hypothetical protein
MYCRIIFAAKILNKKKTGSANKGRTGSKKRRDEEYSLSCTTCASLNNNRKKQYPYQ